MAKCLSVNYNAASLNPPNCFMNESDINGFVTTAMELINTQWKIKERVFRLSSSSLDAYKGSKAAKRLHQQIIDLNNRMKKDVKECLGFLSDDIKKVCYSHMKVEADNLFKLVSNQYDIVTEDFFTAMEKYNGYLDALKSSNADGVEDLNIVRRKVLNALRVSNKTFHKYDFIGSPSKLVEGSATLKNRKVLQQNFYDLYCKNIKALKEKCDNLVGQIK